MANKTSIDELAAVLTKPYTHLELGRVNDHAAYVMHFRDAYPFHRHSSDEMYLVLDGEVTISFRNAPELVLKKGESTVVRAFTSHSPCSKEGALVLMFKPAMMFAGPQDQE
jgi:mannose-6-phosphate isomerase-like protein (cupin superfamily)